MIEKLFSSKARVEILKLFLMNPQNSYYQRQIETLTRQPIRGVQREVAKLERIGLVERSVQGNRTYYRANRNCSIFEPLKEIILKSTGIAEVLQKNFKKQHKIVIAFIYGSYAKGEETLSSDIDLMVVGDITSKEISGILSKPKKDLGREINYAVFSVREFRKRIKNKDHFLNSILKDKKIFITGNKNELKAIVKSG